MGAAGGMDTANKVIGNDKSQGAWGTPELQTRSKQRWFYWKDVVTKDKDPENELMVTPR